jgi:hypothetical protein
MTTQTEALAGAECDRQQSNEQVEPTCWITPDGEGFRMRMTPPVDDVPLGWTPLFDHPPVPTAQPDKTIQNLIDLAYKRGVRAGKYGLDDAAQPDEKTDPPVSDEVILDALGSIDYEVKHHKYPLTKGQIIGLGQKMFELGTKSRSEI